MRFRKKLIELDAVQYRGEGRFGETVPDWVFAAFQSRVLKHDPKEDVLRIETLEGGLTVSLDDWVIRGVKGELYPCNPDIFDELYDAIQDEPPASEGGKKRTVEEEIVVLDAVLDEFVVNCRARLHQQVMAGKGGWDDPKNQSAILADLNVDALAAWSGGDRLRLHDIANRAMMVWWQEWRMTTDYEPGITQAEALVSDVGPLNTDGTG